MRLRFAFLACMTAALLVVARGAVAQMPDPRMMHRQAVPAGELPAGTVTVRVVRQALTNNVPGIVVELHGAGEVRRVETGSDGRAQFSGLPIGARVHAVVAVDGERLESNPIDLPAQGGMRTILVAGLGGDAASPAPDAMPGGATGGGDAGSLLLGNNTRFVVEFQDDTITVFYLLELVNRSASAVVLPSPLTIDLPARAVGTSLLEGASPLATANGPRVTITGPVPPGVTEVPIAFRLEQWDASLTLEQRFPLPLDQVALAAQRLPGLTLNSPQAPSMREAALRQQAFLIGTGPGVPAGAPLQITLSGLPYRNRVPLWITLGLSAGLVLVGIWLSVRRATGEGDERRLALERRRERGLAALAALEAERRVGRVDEEHYSQRRPKLLADLERVYAALDGAPGSHGSQGLAQ